MNHLNTGSYIEIKCRQNYKFYMNVTQDTYITRALVCICFIHFDLFKAYSTSGPENIQDIFITY
jgi:hypothetical protein